MLVEHRCENSTTESLRMEDDVNLVRRTLEGSSAAFADLYDRYAGVIRAICFDATRDLNTAQDLAQDVFLRAYSKLETLRDASRFGPWLISIARYVCHEWQRSRRRDRHQFRSDLPETNERDRRPSDDLSEEIRLAMTQLSEQERLAIHLLYMQEQSPENACKIVGLSYSAFYKLVVRSRMKLSKILCAKKEYLQ